MKTYALLLVVLLFATKFTYASDFESVNHPMSIGVEIGYKAGINAGDVPDGTKNALGFANTPDFGAQFYMPFQGQDYMGLLANIGYYTFPYHFSLNGVSEETKYNFSYVGLGADFFVSGFTVGINYLFPSAAKMNDFELNTDGLKSAFEFRLGGHIPMMVSPSGRLNLNIRASYFVTGQFEENLTIGGKNTNPASLMFGLSYLFNLQSQSDDY